MAMALDQYVDNAIVVIASRPADTQPSAEATPCTPSPLQCAWGDVVFYQLGVGILYKSYPSAAFKICYQYTDSDAAIGALRHAKATKAGFHLEERVLTWDPLAADFHSAWLSVISMAAARGKERIVKYLVSECNAQINPIPDDPDYMIGHLLLRLRFADMSCRSRRVAETRYCG
ncbi:hypothetical protein BGZ61DRAFT_564063 [Ilyonectria robusta]|uniref:uncharacterized protein n=1 Tax=Ilyonectria robusta TaxID=1079257 RepID=UPI001E8E5B01|nr:uncharacterized protein BGZ61DRAFT_564063 [Ilyonectria robusta]KAH8661157.1 hypothetical protein BGZ61DRAFT_564063 [Ilyonectria robusta]